MFSDGKWYFLLTMSNNIKLTSYKSYSKWCWIIGQYNKARTRFEKHKLRKEDIWYFPKIAQLSIWKDIKKSPINRWAQRLGIQRQHTKTYIDNENSTNCILTSMIYRSFPKWNMCLLPYFIRYECYIMNVS